MKKEVVPGSLHQKPMWPGHETTALRKMIILFAGVSPCSQFRAVKTPSGRELYAQVAPAVKAGTATGLLVNRSD